VLFSKRKEVAMGDSVDSGSSAGKQPEAANA
jgi:hypothetical protein